MAEIPNARRYQTRGPNDGSAIPKGSPNRWHRAAGGGDGKFGQQSRSNGAKSESAIPVWAIVTVLLCALLLWLFPGLMLTLVGMGLLVAWLSAKK